MKRVATPKEMAVHLKLTMLPVEAVFDEIMDSIRVAHKESALPRSACTEQCFGKPSEDRRERVGAPGDNESNAA